ncbi:MAG TPA: Hpt domain-containing protein [Candidatus Acidoferrum sp.]|nr:Hpt domain-containing protein [Candidatus Acidoferrum sp.]
MRQPDELSPESVFNLSELLERVDNDSELLREVIGICKAEIPRNIPLLREAVAQVDVKAVENLGHTLKGMLLHLAATRAAAAAGRLEQIGRSGDTTTLGSAVAIFESEVAKLMTELEAYTAKIHP